MYILQQPIYNGAGFDRLNIQFKTIEDAQKYKDTVIQKLEAYITTGLYGNIPKEQAIQNIEEVKKWEILKI